MNRILIARIARRQSAVCFREGGAVLNETKRVYLSECLEFEQVRSGLARKVARIARRAGQQRNREGVLRNGGAALTPFRNSRSQSPYCRAAAIGRRPPHCPEGKRRSVRFLFLKKNEKSAWKRHRNIIAKHRRKSRFPLRLHRCGAGGCSFLFLFWAQFAI